MITHAPEPRLEPYTDFIQNNDLEPERITDYDLELWEEEMCKLSISDEMICEIYRRLGL